MKRASRYGTASPLAELIGNAKSPLPTRMVTRKLSNMICVVESVNFFFLTIKFPLKKHKGTNVLCSQLVPFIIIHLYHYITFCRSCQYIFASYSIKQCVFLLFSVGSRALLKLSFRVTLYRDGFFHLCPQDTTSFAWHTQHHLTEGQHHSVAGGHK